jgi:chorismate-pyruvate lyase
VTGPRGGEAARFEALHQALLTSDSATAVLERFFGAPITVQRLDTKPVPPNADQRRRLALPAEPPAIADWGYRRVRLLSARIVLSEAELWFVPARLPAETLLALAHTPTPFGHLVRALRPKRHSLSARIHPPPSPIALEHRALLTTEHGPIAEVHECCPAGQIGWMRLAG